MSDLIPFDFDSHQVRVIYDDSGAISFVAKDVAAALGYTNYSDALSRHCKGVVKRYPLETAGGMQDVRVITEGDMFRLVTHSKLESAERFESKVYDEILPSIRKTGSFNIENQTPFVTRQLAIKTNIAEVAAKMLRMSDTSKVRMLGKICEEEGISSGFLPDYTEEGLTRALGDLLKEHGSYLSARAANKILMTIGHLEELERRSSRGSVKKFKSITDAGLKYGRNETSTQSPNQTQPRYFIKEFPELLDLINSQKQSN